MYVLFAPMCEGESLTEIVISSNVGNPENPSEPREIDWWSGNRPADESTERGWVVLGDDSRFLESGGNDDVSEWPRDLRVELGHDSPGGGFRSITGAIRIDDTVPGYAPDADIEEIEYLFGDPRTDDPLELWTPNRMRLETGCAGQYL
ncbi:hypothetical protein [Stackebrandtia albiflava]|uniref:hypothetical protein n=1 Tax=Stackebrandtia albiflava TaxID=406432 RepID=UPI0011BF8F82|nr:hypothetical protein [Stackebrandtia albiflava]